MSWAEVARKVSTTKAVVIKARGSLDRLCWRGVLSSSVGHRLLARAHASQNGNPTRTAVLIDRVGVGEASLSTPGRWLRSCTLGELGWANLLGRLAWVACLGGWAGLEASLRHVRQAWPSRRSCISGQKVTDLDEGLGKGRFFL